MVRQRLASVEGSCLVMATFATRGGWAERLERFRLVGCRRRRQQLRPSRVWEGGDGGEGVWLPRRRGGEGGDGVLRLPLGEEVRAAQAVRGVACDRHGDADRPLALG